VVNRHSEPQLFDGAARGRRKPYAQIIGGLLTNPEIESNSTWFEAVTWRDW
jgi:hypothetical protein